MRPLWLAVVALTVAIVAVYILMHMPAPPPVSALLFPFGDVPAIEVGMTFYVMIGRPMRYVTVPAAGNATITTNTTGWYVKLDKTAPIGASRTLPLVGHYVNATLEDGSAVQLWNYNDTHGFVVRVAPPTGGGYTPKYAWAAKIIKARGAYIWYPTEADSVMMNYMARALGPHIVLYEPRFDYLAFDTVNFYVYADCFDGAWHIRSCPAVIPLASFTELTPGSSYIVAGLEQEGDIYVYYPVFAVYYTPSVSGNYTTYLRVDAR